MAVVNIYAAKTWGAMGNFVAAKHLSTVLAKGGHDVKVTASEELISFMRRAGSEIKELTLAAANRQELNQNYWAFANRSADLLVPDFETATGPAPVSLDGLVEDLRRHRPDIVIATKGVLARMLVWAAREARLDCKVWHHVTNPGLAEMPMHRCPGAAATTVPWPENKDRLIELVGLQPGRVHVTGPLLAARSMPAVTEAVETRSQPVILLFNNRSGDAFFKAVDHLVRARHDCKVVYLTVDQPQEVAALEPAFAARGWEIYERLPQDRYLALLTEAARSPGSYLVCKASPATVYESAYQAIPLVALPSGLPQEEWVPDFVEREGIGVTVNSADELIQQLTAWRNVAATEWIRANCHRFREHKLEQGPVEEHFLRIADDLYRGRI